MLKINRQTLEDDMSYDLDGLSTLVQKWAAQQPNLPPGCVVTVTFSAEGTKVAAARGITSVADLFTQEAFKAAGLRSKGHLTSLKYMVENAFRLPPGGLVDMEVEDLAEWWRRKRDDYIPNVGLTRKNIMNQLLRHYGLM